MESGQYSKFLIDTLSGSKEFFAVALIKASVNIEGCLNLKNYSDFTERFLNLKYVFIDVFGDKRKFFVEDFYFSGEQPVIKFRNFDSIDDIKFLIGKEIFIDKKNFVQSKSDEFLISELIGAEVFRGNEFFGKLMDVEAYPGNDVLVIEDKNGKEILVPSVKEFIEKVDREKKEIYLNPESDFDYDED